MQDEQLSQKVPFQAAVGAGLALIDLAAAAGPVIAEFLEPVLWFDRMGGEAHHKFPVGFILGFDESRLMVRMFR